MAKILRGDNVLVVLGKDSGKVAKVSKVLTKENKVFVEGVNVYKRHISGKRQGIEEGGIVDIQKPVYTSNVMLVCPNCNKPTRVGFKIVKNEQSSRLRTEKTRICRKCGKDLHEQIKK